MLMALNERNAVVNIAEAQFPAPFKSSLEYSPPARGNWNIVHVGMLVPESHQIYAAAQACLRGVVLTAAEMGCMERFSTIAVEEKNLIDGKIDTLIIDGVSDILEKLPKRPKALLLFTTCIHNFIGCDLNYVYSELRKKFPDVDFVILLSTGYSLSLKDTSYSIPIFDCISFFAILPSESLIKIITCLAILGITSQIFLLYLLLF